MSATSVVVGIDVAKAIAALSESLRIDIKNAEAHKVLGRALMIIGRFDAAKIEFEQAVRLKPDSAENHYNLGTLYSAQDIYPPAKRAFEEAIRIDPAYMEAHNGLGFALEAIGDDAGAVAAYKKAAELNQARGGHFASPYVNLSAYCNREGNPDLALEYARRIKDPIKPALVANRTIEPTQIAGFNQFFDECQAFGCLIRKGANDLLFGACE